MSKLTCYFSTAFLIFASVNANAENPVDGYELIYQEQEAGTEPYQVKFTVTERYIRIDQLDDQSGYIIYDNNKHVIRSVTHADESILVIPRYDYQRPDFRKLVKLNYSVLADAPKIAGKEIFNYRVVSATNPEEKCLDIKLAEGLLPDVSHLFLDYQEMLAAQQSRLLDATPKEFQTTCYLYDQVFNKGDYYRKGLPIQEWHSNGKQRLLVSYKKIQVDPAIFQLKETYKEYSLD